MKRWLYGAVVIAQMAITAGFKNADKPVHVIGKEIKNFRLMGTGGNVQGLTDHPGAKGFIIVFTCNHCPFAKLYTGRLNALNSKYKPLGVPLLAINPMDTLLYEAEKLSHMKERAATAKFNFPYLQDAAQLVARDFAVTHTPAAYVVWKKGGKWIIEYSGAIDNNGGEPQAATPFVANAVDELLQGKPVSTPETASIGCGVMYRKARK